MLRQRFRLAPSTVLLASSEGLVLHSSAILRIDLGDRTFERQLIALVDGGDFSVLEERYGRGPTERAIQCLVEAGALTPVDGEVIVLVADISDGGVEAQLDEARQAGSPVLLAWISGSSIAIACDDGRNRPCVRCALLFDRQALRAARQADGARGAVAVVRSTDTAIRGLAASLAAILAEPGRPLPRPGRALVFDAATSTTSWERFPAHPSCTCATRLGMDSGEHGVQDGWQSGGRFVPLICSDEGRPGRPAKVLYRRSGSPWPLDTAAFGFATAAGLDQTIRAFAEGVERFGMLHARCDRRATAARDLDAPTLDEPAIRSLLFRPEDRRRPGFRFRDYGAEVPLDWSWAERLASGTRALVPTTLVGRPSGSLRLVDASSNGYAAHRSSERALELATLEAIERDALLATWYLQLSSTAIAIEDETVAASQGVEISGRLVTQDVDVPVVWLVAHLPDGSIRSAASAALAFDEAFQNAFRELLAALESSRHPQKVDDVPDLADLSLRHGPVDHLHYYSSRENVESAFGWLNDAGKVRLADLRRRWPDRRAAQGMGSLVDILRTSGLELWAVDRGLPDLFGTSWHVARALIPGAVELSWGNGYRRLASPRVDRWLAAGATLNVWPHPVF